MKRAWRKQVLRKLALLVVPRIISFLLRIVFATIRVSWVNYDKVDRLHADRKNVIFAFWHQRMLPFVYTNRNQGVTVLVSQHHDGELIARTLERLGFQTVRGSSTRGGFRALVEMIRAGNRGIDLAVTPDGPRGPLHVLQAGVVLLAQRSGLPVVLSTWGVTRYWQLPSWDGFMIPKPFSRLTITVSDPVFLPPKLDEDEFETWRQRLEGELRALTTASDAQAAGSPSVTQLEGSGSG